VQRVSVPDYVNVRRAVPQFPVPAVNSAGFPVSGYGDVRFSKLRDFAYRQFSPVSVAQDWRGSSPSIPVTTMASSHESASGVSSTWSYPYGFPSVKNSPSGSGPFPPGQGFSQFGYPQANPYGVMPWGVPPAWQCHPQFWGGPPTIPCVPRKSVTKRLRTHTVQSHASTEPSNGDSDEEAGQDSQPLLEIQSRLLLLQFQCHKNFLVLLPR